jgi:malate permease and related proteins
VSIVMSSFSHTQPLAILAPIVITTGVGYLWGKLDKHFPADFITLIVLKIGTPCLILGVMAKMDVELQALGQVALATGFSMLLMGFFGWFLLRALRCDTATYLPALIFPNNGNIGLPLCLYAFGQTGLALAMGSFMVMMLASFTVGLFIVAHPTNKSEGSDKSNKNFKKNIEQRLLEIAKEPVLYAMLIATILLMTHTRLPQWTINTLDLLGGIAIPLMAIALGVSLSSLKIVSWSRTFFLSMTRVFGGLFLGLLVCELMQVEGVSRNVVLLQSAMPVAVFNYLMALRYNHQPKEVAAMVVMSTLLAFFSLPFLLMVML